MIKKFLINRLVIKLSKDSSHLVKPIHADVLLRIESTNSESSRGDTEVKNNNNSTKIKDAASSKNVKKLELIEATQNVEISERTNSPKSHKKSLNELVDSNDEGKNNINSKLFVTFFLVLDFSDYFDQYFPTPQTSFTSFFS